MPHFITTLFCALYCVRAVKETDSNGNYNIKGRMITKQTKLLKNALLLQKSVEFHKFLQ